MAWDIQVYTFYGIDLFNSSIYDHLLDYYAEDARKANKEVDDYLCENLEELIMSHLGLEIITPVTCGHGSETYLILGKLYIVCDNSKGIYNNICLDFPDKEKLDDFDQNMKKLGISDYNIKAWVVTYSN